LKTIGGNGKIASMTLEEKITFFTPITWRFLTRENSYITAIYKTAMTKLINSSL